MTFVSLAEKEKKELDKLDSRGCKRMQCESLKSKGYSESKVSDRLHQN